MTSHSWRLSLNTKGGSRTERPKKGSSFNETHGMVSQGLIRINK